MHAVKILSSHAQGARDHFHVVKRQAIFKYWYFASLLQRDKFHSILEAVREKFKDPWIYDVTLKALPNVGPDVTAEPSIYWDAPIAVAVHRRGDDGICPAVCMSLCVIGDVVYVMQLQGMAGTHIPPQLQNWPKMFVEACQDFAIKKNFRQVRIVKATSVPQFNMAGLQAETPAALAKMRANVQNRMLARYDGTAKKLGFVEDGRWFIWPNPQHQA